MKLTRHIYACNNLTNFKQAVHAITGNGKSCKSAEIDFEKIVKAHQVNLFWADFNHLKSLCAAATAWVWRHPAAAAVEKHWSQDIIIISSFKVCFNVDLIYGHLSVFQTTLRHRCRTNTVSSPFHVNFCKIFCHFLSS